ncbi:hypothetical protein CFP56_011976 [Quercus suber]|uniref:Uncharacterized protein n=1 Tax=Quercus suber TaxID=58331 RepID=A0AAW0KWJ3_QUESU
MSEKEKVVYPSYRGRSHKFQLRPKILSPQTNKERERLDLGQNSASTQQIDTLVQGFCGKLSK